jgi:hypothetical protein
LSLETQLISKGVLIMFKKAIFTAAAALICSSTFAQSGEVYGGLGGNLGYGLNIGYAMPLSENWVGRADFAGGLSLTKNGITNGNAYTGKFTNNREGLFADYFPFGGKFRLTGGLTFNQTDIKLNVNGSSASTVTVNGKSVSTAGNYYNVNVTFPSTTPFLGLGWGHHRLQTDTGWGFFTELGFNIGRFTATSSTNLVGQNGITQTDVNAENQKITDSLSKLSVLPSFSIGASYKF